MRFTTFDLVSIAQNVTHNSYIQILPPLLTPSLKLKTGEKYPCHTQIKNVGTLKGHKSRRFLGLPGIAFLKFLVWNHLICNSASCSFINIKEAYSL